MRKGLLAVCLIGAALAAVFASAGGGRSAPPPADAEHDFGNKVLLIATHARNGKGEGGSQVLEKARVRRLGDRYFVVGRWVDLDEKRVPPEMTVWTPLADVDHLTEFDSVDAVRKAYADREKRERVRDE